MIPVNNNEIKEALIHYLYEEAGIEDEVGATESLVDGGILDSFDLVALSAFLVTKYKIKIGALDVTLENFDSIEKIANFVERKL